MARVKNVFSPTWTCWMSFIYHIYYGIYFVLSTGNMPEPTGKLVAKTTTEYPPCALKFHPLDSSIILIGTYMYDEATKLKTGSIDVLHNELLSKENLDSGDGSAGLRSGILDKLLSIPTDSAVLDLQFSPFDDNLFATAHSKGNVVLWRTVIEDARQIKIEKLQAYQAFEPSNLITSLRFSDSQPDNIVITTTSGETALLTLANSKLVSTTTFDHSHSMEAWIGNFGNFELRNVVFTGGDDLTLIANDIRTNDNIFKCTNLHDAGITSILTATPGDHRGNGSWLNSNSDNRFQLYTGSYDDCLKISDLRYMPDSHTLLPYPPRCVESINLQGGVWRLVPFKQDPARLLSCCMYDGAKVLDVKTHNQKINVERVFRENHTSMVYGGDTSFNDSQHLLMATCSFYDCSVQVWSPDLAS